MAANIPKHDHIFYNGVTITDETVDCIMPVVSDESTLMLEIISDGTVSLQVYGSIFDKEHFKLLPVFKFPTLELITTNITDKSCFYQVDLTSVDYIKVVLTSVSDTTTVRGKVVG